MYEVIRVLNYTLSNFDLKIISFDREKNSKNYDRFINIEIIEIN